MRTTKYVLFTALGIAAVLLLTSDRAKEMRDELEDTTKKNAKKWKDKLVRIGGDASDKLADLKALLSNEIAGLSDDARERIEHILDGTGKTAAQIKKNVRTHLS